MPTLHARLALSSFGIADLHVRTRYGTCLKPCPAASSTQSFALSAGRNITSNRVICISLHNITKFSMFYRSFHKVELLRKISKQRCVFFLFAGEPV